MEELGLLRPKANVPAILSLILSIGSLCCCCVWYLGLMGAVASIVLGVFGLTNKRIQGRDAAIAGIVIGVVALILALIAAGMTIYLTSRSGEYYGT